uniref:Putative LOV domain-containing protein n=1 Tax=Isoetes tegetiformans TaxID=264945 RepID=A0A126X0J1_9TRAC|nr:putative LOV domain-containing protein [Isoetes tegetiformans]
MGMEIGWLSSFALKPPELKDEDPLSESLSSRYKSKVREALQQCEYNFVLCDPRLPDHPIVYASEGFLKMTGYSKEEVLGHNCRFLQGPDTDKRMVTEIRDAIREERSCQVQILNYTKHGKPFWNLFYLAPIYSREDGKVIHFLGVQTPISHRLATAFVQTVDSSEEVCDEDSGLEEEFQAAEEDKEVATRAIKSIVYGLKQSAKNEGVAERKCKSMKESAALGVICSSLMLQLSRVQQSFVLADPHLPDTPIVHASESFLNMTGYSRDEVIGRNCRFLQGPDTDQNAIDQIRASIKDERPCTVRILNYRKNKQPFWNFLHLAPVRSSDGQVAFFVGVQLDVTLADANGNLEDGMDSHLKQLGAVGAIKVAVRSLQGVGLKRQVQC